jgi:hypothetical protein
MVSCRHMVGILTLLLLVVSNGLIVVEGQSDENPIKIPHITAKEFEYLIEAIYNMFVKHYQPV